MRKLLYTGLLLGSTYLPAPAYALDGRECMTDQLGVPLCITPNDLSSFAIPNNVKKYGAVGDSNGTHGNGTDDTTAIQSAITSATNGDVYFPCGVYRITSTLTANSGGVYHLHGNGFCSQIYNDATGSIQTLQFNPPGFCASINIPCAVVEGLNFIAPNSNGSGNYAINATNEQRIRIRGNWFAGYRVAVALTTSYAPEILENTFKSISSSAVFMAADSTANSAIIAFNQFYTVGKTTNDAALILSGTSVGSPAVGALIEGNDIEDVYGGAVLTNVTGVTIRGNFFDINTNFHLYFAGTASNYDINANWFGGATATEWDFTNSTVANNSFNTTITFGTAALGNLVYNNSGAVALGALPIYTVSTLPTCNAAAEGLRNYVKDNTAAPAFHSIAAGTGGVHTSVYCDGTNWLVD